MTKYSKFMIILLLLIVLCVTTSCNKIAGDESRLTTAEKLEDFNYLYETLKENYPYFQALQRKYNTDWLANQETYRDKIQNTKGDWPFYVSMVQILSELKLGHTFVIPPTAFIQKIKSQKC